MSKKEKAAAAPEDKQGKGKGKGGKKGRKGEAGAGAERAIRVGAHPRARRSIRRARAQAGIAGFVVTLVLAHQAGVPAFETLLRALGGGMVAHFLTWAFAIALWRRLIVVELETAREDVVRRRTERDAAAAVAAMGNAVSASAPGTAVGARLRGA